MEKNDNGTKIEIATQKEITRIIISPQTRHCSVDVHT